MLIPAACAEEGVGERVNPFRDEQRERAGNSVGFIRGVNFDARVSGWSSFLPSLRSSAARSSRGYIFTRSLGIFSCVYIPKRQALFAARGLFQNEHNLFWG